MYWIEGKIEIFNVLGAGDGFMSGFLKGWINDNDISKCSEYGNACGALAVSRHGCAPSYPSLEELNYFMKVGSTEFSLRKDKALEQIHWSTNRNIKYNRLFAFAFDHRTQFENWIKKYNKNKLVPFGEFLPFENFFKKIGLKKITQGYQSYSADNKREILNIDKLKFIPLICYEIIYSGKINPSKKYYDFILNISEDGWFGKSIGPAQHLTHSIFRSIEEGKYLLRSANNGISAHVSLIGKVNKKLSTTEKGSIEINSVSDKFREIQTKIRQIRCEKMPNFTPQNSKIKFCQNLNFWATWKLDS